MPYIINKTNGAQITIVQDGTIDNTTDLTLVGKNYAGYGEAFNENFIKLLENFSNPTQPSKPLAGQIWYDSGKKKLRVYDGTKFKTIGMIESGTAYPLTPLVGDLWYSQTDLKLKAWNGSRWDSVGPATVAGGGLASNAATVAPVIKAIDSLSVYVVEQIVNGLTATVVSTVPAFDVYTTDPVNSDFRFPKLYPGINLPKTDQYGISAHIDFTTTTSNRIGNLLWGTSASALGLVDDQQKFVSINDLVLTRQLNTGTTYPIIIKNNDGLTIGSQSIIKIHVTDTNIGNISVINGPTLKFNLLVGSNQYYNVYSITTSTLSSPSTPAILPNPSASINIGGSGIVEKFGKVYGTSFYGSGAGLTDIPNSAVTGTISIVAGTGLSGGGAVSLGGTVTINGSTFGAGSIYGSSNIAVTSSGSGVVISLPSTISVNSATFTSTQITNLISNGTTSTIYGNWKLAAGAKFQATYADLAERYAADAEYEPGTVLVIGGSAEVTTTTYHGAPSVAGIVSTKPAYTLNEEAGNDATHPYIALKGRVPCKIVGPVFKGELLVTSSRAGYAERIHANDNPNAVLGRALEALDDTVGIIEVMVI